MQPTLIAVRSNNKTAVYSYIDNGSYGIFESEIKGNEGDKYFIHKGVNYFLPLVFQGKQPICRF